MNSNNHILGTFKEVWEVLLKLGYQPSNGNKTLEVLLNPMDETFYNELCSKINSVGGLTELKSEVNLEFLFSRDYNYEEERYATRIHIQGIIDNSMVFNIVTDAHIETDGETGDPKMVVGEVFEDFNNTQYDTQSDLGPMLRELIEALNYEIYKDYVEEYLPYNPGTPIKNY